MSLAPRRLIAIGNRDRGDDGVAFAVLRCLAHRLPADVAALECPNDPTRLIALWRGASVAVVVDAAGSGTRPPGALHRYDATHQDVPAMRLRPASHTFGLAETIELARALGALPARLIVYGIEGADFERGSRLSDDVEAAVPAAATAVLADITAPIAP